MGTTSFDFSQAGIFPPPGLLASGPDDDIKTLVTPAEGTVSDEDVSADAPDDGGSGPDDETKTK